jgi:hypothetical protein
VSPPESHAMSTATDKSSGTHPDRYAADDPPASSPHVRSRPPPHMPEAKHTSPHHQELDHTGLKPNTHHPTTKNQTTASHHHHHQFLIINSVCSYAFLLDRS